MNTVEREYRSRLGRLTGQERVALAVGLLNELRRMVRHRIERSRPELTSREVDREVAAALYRTDRSAQQLLSLVDDHE